MTAPTNKRRFGGEDKMETLIVLALVVWLPLALGVGAVAQERGNSFGNWFLIALVTSAPLALLFLIAMPSGGTVDDHALRRNICLGRVS
jgi:hypothetical protein